jgi:hypothetical protein
MSVCHPITNNSAVNFVMGLKHLDGDVILLYTYIPVLFVFLRVPRKRPRTMKFLQDSA